MVPINIRDPFMKDPFFSSTWDEFDAMRTEMMEKSKSFWGQVDKVIRRSENNGEIKPPQWESRSWRGSDEETRHATPRWTDPSPPGRSIIKTARIFLGFCQLRGRRPAAARRARPPGGSLPAPASQVGDPRRGQGQVAGRHAGRRQRGHQGQGRRGQVRGHAGRVTLQARGPQGVHRQQRPVHRGKARGGREARRRGVRQVGRRVSPVRPGPTPLQPSVPPSRSSSVVRQFARKWTLPGDCDPNDVVSNLSSDGVLMVTAPRNGLTADPRRAIKHWTIAMIASGKATAARRPNP